MGLGRRGLEKGEQDWAGGAGIRWGVGGKVKGSPWCGARSIPPCTPTPDGALGDQELGHSAFLGLHLAAPERQSAPEERAPGLTGPCGPANPGTVQGHFTVIKGKRQVICSGPHVALAACVPSINQMPQEPLVDRT